jgi:hypothetical protein
MRMSVDRSTGLMIWVLDGMSARGKSIFTAGEYVFSLLGRGTSFERVTGFR